MKLTTKTVKIDLLRITKKEILRLPERNPDDIEKAYNGILLVPTRRKHESGYSCICLVGLSEQNEAEICGYPDDVVWNISEELMKYGELLMRTDATHPHGIIHVWSNEASFVVGGFLSSQDVTLVKRITNQG